MSDEVRNDSLPRDYSTWGSDFSEETRVMGIRCPRWNSRSIFGALAVFCLVLILGCYAGSKTWSDGTTPLAISLPSNRVSEPAEREFALPLREIESLIAALREQNATNQQLVMAIGSLRSEQQELRKQIATMLVAKQKPALTTGSINPRPQTRAVAKQPKDAPLAQRH